MYDGILTAKIPLLGIISTMHQTQNTKNQKQISGYKLVASQGNAPRGPLEQVIYSHSSLFTRLPGNIKWRGKRSTIPQPSP